MLNKLTKITNTKGKRKGRGIGSGKGGHTVGRGTKGHKARSGFQQPRPGFEGGQMPLSRRLPKLKGFSREFFKKKHVVKIVKLNDLEKNFVAGDTVDLEALLKIGIITSKKQQIKILADGKLSKKLNLKNIKVSKAARAQIEASKGTVSL